MRRLGAIGPATVIAIAVLGIAMAAAASEPPSAGADGSGATLTVDFDSQIDIHGLGDGSGDFHLEYLAQPQIALPTNASGLASGSTAGVYAKAAGTLTGDDGTSVTVTGGTGDSFDVIGFDPGGNGSGPSIALNLHQPTESYHAHDSEGYDYDYDDHLWLQTFEVFHHPANGQVVLPLDKGFGQVLAQGTWTSATPDGGATETTTVTVTASCPGGSAAGTVTLSAGDAPPLGSVMCTGQQIKLGPKSRLEVTFKDGTVMRVGPNSEATIDESSGQGSSGVSYGAHVILGEVWARVSDALGGGSTFEMTTERGVLGVRGRVPPSSTLRVSESAGASFLFDQGPKGTPLYHQIVGTGFAQLTGKPAVKVPAGYGVLIGAKSLKLTPKLSTTQLALLPEGERPPAIKGLKVQVKGEKGGAVASFKLDEAAKLNLQAARGRKTLATRSLKGKAGRNRVALGNGFTSGKFTLTVKADAAGRVAVGEERFRGS